jgi:hypothetical protein
MLAQAYSFILLQGLIHFTVFEPVILVFLLVVALSQAGLLRVMNRYLKTHDWRTALRFWHSPFETSKFCVAIFAAGAYLYLMTGHRPFPRDQSLYKDVGIIGNLAFQLFNLAMSFAINWLSKVAPNQPEPPPSNRYQNIIARVIAMSLGLLGIVVSCHDKKAFYVFGVLGYGIITICMGPFLTRDPHSWVRRNE